jgi:hypothetical protein
VQIVLFTVLGGCVMVIAYALGVPGPVCGILFLGGYSPGRSCGGAPDHRLGHQA